MRPSCRDGLAVSIARDFALQGPDQQSAASACRWSRRAAGEIVGTPGVVAAANAGDVSYMSVIARLVI